MIRIDLPVNQNDKETDQSGGAMRSHPRLAETDELEVKSVRN
jgi:hypothetical protein